jgi:hypothetical protein
VEDTRGQTYRVKIQGKLRKHLVSTVYMEADKAVCGEEKDKSLKRERANRKAMQRAGLFWMRPIRIKNGAPHSKENYWKVYRPPGPDSCSSFIGGFKVSGTCEYNRHIYPNIISFNMNSAILTDRLEWAQKDEDELFTLVMGSVPNSVRPSKCKKFDELEQNKEYTVLALQKVNYRGERWIMQLEGESEYILSTYWFERSIESVDLKYRKQ